MPTNQIKFLVLAAAAGAVVTGLNLRPWAGAASEPVGRCEAAPSGVGALIGGNVGANVGRGTAVDLLLPVAAEPAAEAPKARRREAVTRLPSGTFVKEMDAAPYGNGKITLTYAEDKVFSTISASVFGFQFDIQTEAEVSLSTSGVVYGVVTGFKVSNIRAGMLGAEKGAEAFQLYASMVNAAEPLINEMTIDMPFSYHIRAADDRVTLSQFRVMLAGPSPLGKAGAFMGGDSGLAVLGYFQAINVALEGTYTAEGAKPRGPEPRREPAAPQRMGLLSR